MFNRPFKVVAISPRKSLQDHPTGRKSVTGYPDVKSPLVRDFGACHFIDDQAALLREADSLQEPCAIGNRVKTVLAWKEHGPGNP